MTAKNLFEDFIENPGKPKLTKAPREMAIKKFGSAIVIPENLTYGAASAALAERAIMEEEPMNRRMVYTCHPNDGYVAITRLIEEVFGYTTARSEMFNSATTARIRTGLGVDDYIEALSGGVIGIPTCPDIEIRVAGDAEEMQFLVQVTAKEKHKIAVNAFLSELERRIREESIYHGKAFDSKFEFLDLSGADSSKVILPATTEKQVRANLFTPLQHRDKLQRVGTPFGRSVLLEGPYGTGKTLLAFCAGRYAVEKGITFIYVRAEDHHKLPLYLRYARQYAPAVIFYEDIDLLMGGDDSDRDDGINLVLNTLDGIDAKSGAANDVMLVMTTNNVEVINEGFMRPGRIDAVIHIGLPDADAAGRLIAQYGGVSLALDFDFTQAGLACEGMTPAFIREVVERSKLVALSRDPDSEWQNIETDDVTVAAQEIQDHLRLANPRKHTHTMGDRLVGAFEEVVDKAVRNVVGPMADWASDESYWSESSLPAGDAPTPLPMPDEVSAS